MSKIFVSSYACEPHKGSEITVGWNWIIQLSKRHDLWVLTRKTNQLHIEKYIKKNKYQFKNIKFIYFDLPAYLRFWKKGMRGVRLYYVLWTFFSDRIIKNEMEKNFTKTWY